MSTLDTPRIYVACLASYNNGILHGEWIDATLSVDEIHEHIRAMLKASPMADAEEHAIHDIDGFGKIPISEYESIFYVNCLAIFIQEHGGQGLALLEHFLGDIEDAERALENYAGRYEGLSAYAQQLTEDTTEIPENLSFYIDYEKIASDMKMSGDVFTIEFSHNEVDVYYSH